MTPEERAEMATPTAVDLIAAVARGNADEVAALLEKVTDWPALAVVLADRAAEAGGETYVQAVLDDICLGHVTTPQIARRYGLTLSAVEHLAADNGLVLPESEPLTAGRWVTRRGGLRTWVAEVAS